MMNVTLCSRKAVTSAREMLVALAVFVGVCSVSRCTTGCDALRTKDPTEAERNYTTEIIACAATAGFPGAYDEQADLRCRRVVDCKYGVGPCPASTQQLCRVGSYVFYGDDQCRLPN